MLAILDFIALLALSLKHLIDDRIIVCDPVQHSLQFVCRHQLQCRHSNVNAFKEVTEINIILHLLSVSHGCFLPE